MASNFQVFCDKNETGMLLKLFGDFDATSAYELIDILKKRSDGSSKVFIHTDGLKNIYPFGLHIFHKSLRIMNGQSARIVFTGNKASGLSLE
jgi:stage II sporulation protein AA (anti-sigma F factor antagonist)